MYCVKCQAIFFYHFVLNSLFSLTYYIAAHEAFKIDGYHQETAGDVEDLFSVSNIDLTIKQLTPSLLKAFFDNNIGIAPLVLSCCLLAFLWLLGEHGKYKSECNVSVG